eukprot:TRINITY_DN1100_c0_g1_i1.p1 TRINITY_DN1100_c0_g1~~TRINITY_DN1100_c0_g1_i1.p1  ORF type:complete len:207 (+),score=32.33 TRINITY_DN1100_c0_g1_i1:67-687(+)
MSTRILFLSALLLAIVVAGSIPVPPVWDDIGYCWHFHQGDGQQDYCFSFFGEKKQRILTGYDGGRTEKKWASLGDFAKKKEIIYDPSSFNKSFGDVVDCQCRSINHSYADEQISQGALIPQDAFYIGQTQINDNVCIGFHYDMQYGPGKNPVNFWISDLNSFPVRLDEKLSPGYYTFKDVTLSPDYSNFSKNQLWCSSRTVNVCGW